MHEAAQTPAQELSRPSLNKVTYTLASLATAPYQTSPNRKQQTALHDTHHMLTCEHAVQKLRARRAGGRAGACARPRGCPLPVQYPRYVRTVDTVGVLYGLHHFQTANCIVPELATHAYSVPVPGCLLLCGPYTAWHKSGTNDERPCVCPTLKH